MLAVHYCIWENLDSTNSSHIIMQESYMIIKHLSLVLMTISAFQLTFYFHFFLSHCSEIPGPASVFLYVKLKTIVFTRTSDGKSAAASIVLC